MEIPLLIRQNNPNEGNNPLKKYIFAVMSMVFEKILWSVSI